jgi:hypothetical protein
MISLRQRVLWASMLASATFVSAGAFAQTPAVTPATPAVQAQPQAGVAPQDKHMKHGDHAKRMERMERMQAHRAKRMAELKTKLALTTAQEGAWADFTTATQPPAMRPQRLDRAEFAKLTTPQRLERMQARQAERSAMFAKRADATKVFYATLSADQQKTFDAETARFGRGGHEWRHGHEGQRTAPAAKG